MKYFLSVIGIILSYLIIRYRESLGDTFGERDWMKYFGGIYGVLVILAVFIFFWSIATITGTTDLLLAPVLYILPGGRPTPLPPGF